MYDEAAFLDTESEIDYGVAYTEYEAKVEKFARPIWEICWDSNASDFLVEEIRVRIADYCCPTSVRYWGKMDDYSQIAVEILPIALFLYNKREQTWDKYTEEETRDVVPLEPSLLVRGAKKAFPASEPVGTYAENESGKTHEHSEITCPVHELCP